MQLLCKSLETALDDRVQGRLVVGCACEVSLGERLAVDVSPDDAVQAPSAGNEREPRLESAPYRVFSILTDTSLSWTATRYRSPDVDDDDVPV